MIYPLKIVDLSIVFCMLKPFRVTDVSRDKLANSRWFNPGVFALHHFFWYTTM